MKLLVFYAFVVVAGVKMVDTLAAAKIGQNAQDIQLLRYDSANDGLGTYSFAYEQSDGSRRNEEGELKNAGAEKEYIAVRGSYSWDGPDGVTYTVSYIADDKGYQPIFETSPISGTLPPAIASLLA